MRMRVQTVYALKGKCPTHPGMGWLRRNQPKRMLGTGPGVMLGTEGSGEYVKESQQTWRWNHFAGMGHLFEGKERGQNGSVFQPTSPGWGGDPPWGCKYELNKPVFACIIKVPNMRGKGSRGLQKQPIPPTYLCCCSFFFLLLPLCLL